MSLFSKLLTSFKKVLKKKKKTKARKTTLRKRKIRPVQFKRKKHRRTTRSKKAIRPPQKTSEGILVGEITHFFSRIQVVVIKVTRGSIQWGDRLHIKGPRTDFVQKVTSLQIESVDVKIARKGQLAGLKVSKKARPGDHVYKVS